MTISCRDHFQDWSIAHALQSVTHDTSPYFLVNGGQDVHGLLLQVSIGLRKYFLCPCTPVGQQGILCDTDPKGDNGIGTLYSHQYRFEDKREVMCHFIREVMWHWTWKVLYLYGFLQKRHLGCYLSQAVELLLWRSSTQIVLRSSSSSVSCSGGVVSSFWMSPSSKPLIQAAFPRSVTPGISSVPGRLKIYCEKIQVIPKRDTHSGNLGRGCRYTKF